MKRGRIIIGMLIVVFIFILIVSMIDEQAGDSEENILRTVMDKSNLIEWLYSDSAVSIGYGECVFDSDCGTSIIGIRKCGGNNIIQEIAEKKCEGGKCFDRISSQIIPSGRAPICNICDDSSEEPKFVHVADGASCNDELGRAGVCSAGKCSVESCDDEKYKKALEGMGSCFTCDDSSGRPMFRQKPDGVDCNYKDGVKGACITGECKSVPEIFDTERCGKGYCIRGETCYGKETNNPVCCDDKTEKPGNEINILYQFSIFARLQKKVTKEELLIINELVKKHNINSIPHRTLAKFADLGKNKQKIYSLNIRYIQLLTEITLLKTKSMFGVDSEELKSKEEELNRVSKELEPYKINQDEWQYLPQLLEFEKDLKNSGIEEPEKKIDEILKVLGAILSDYGAENFRTYFCEKTEEYSCESQGKKTCPGTLGDACCPVSGPGSACMKYSSTYQSLFGNFVKDIPEMSFGACGNSVNPEEFRWLGLEEIEKKKELICSSQGLKYCPIGTPLGKDTAAVKCCEIEEECVKGKRISGLPTLWLYSPPSCQPASCDKDYENECVLNGRRICCRKGIETCVPRPSNSLECVDWKEIVKRASMTFGTSVYMIRDADDFSLNGKAYVISPHVDFNKEAEVVVNDEIKEGQEVYKYQDHDAVLNSCDIEELEKISKEIGSNGGVVRLSGISLDIPSGALNESVKLTIASYGLSNCYEVGKKKVDAGEFEISEELQEEIGSMIKKENNNFIGGIVFLVIIILLILIILFWNRFFKK